LEPIPNPNLIYSVATDISESGFVTGYGISSPESPWRGYQVAFQYSQQTGFSILESVPAYSTHGLGINNRGQIALWASGATNDRALRYTPDLGLQDLGSLGGGDSGVRGGINLSGQVAGSSDRGNGTTGAYRYSDGVGMIDLGTLGGANSYGHDINDAGSVTGRAQAADGIFHAFLYQDGVGMVDLGAGAGYAVNNRGVVAGFANGWILPVLYVDETVLHLPKGFSFGPYSLNDLNDANVMVGEAGSRAFIGTLEEGVIDLNTLIDPDSGWILTRAYGINNLGQIVGSGSFEGRGMAVLLNPIPEPGTWALLLLGVGLLAVRRRLKKE
jgi:probable HAF family extracellular repeat protein